MRDRPEKWLVCTQGLAMTSEREFGYSSEQWDEIEEATGVLGLPEKSALTAIVSRSFERPEVSETKAELRGARKDLDKVVKRIEGLQRCISASAFCIDEIFDHANGCPDFWFSEGLENLVSAIDLIDEKYIDDNLSEPFTSNDDALGLELCSFWFRVLNRKDKYTYDPDTGAIKETPFIRFMKLASAPIRSGGKGFSPDQAKRKLKLYQKAKDIDF